MILEELYKQKLALFQELGQITDEIATLPCERLVDDDDALKNIQDSLESRQNIMKEIEQISLKIRGFSDEALDQSMLSLREAIHEEILKIEQQNKDVEKTVKLSLAELRRRTKKAQDGRHTNRAYAGRITDREGSFIDKRR